MTIKEVVAKYHGYYRAGLLTHIEAMKLIVEKCRELEQHGAN